jgi:conjugal transfer pilus assembly protein TraU
MKVIDWVRAIALALLMLTAVTAPRAAGTCFGKFANPITDMCWSCVMPISIGSATVASFSQEDIGNPSGPVCFCSGVPPKVGLEVGFWEPARIVEVTRTPYCLVSLGGIEMDPGVRAPRGAQESRTVSESSVRGSFYQVHYYTNPVLFWLKVIYDFPCLEKGAFDVAYISELDPTWADDEMAAVLSPEGTVLSNIIATAACSADCVAATVGFPIKELFWCDGCNGTVYPIDGHVSAHVGGVQASSLLMHRMLLKMHRQLLAWRWHGKDAQCGPKLDPIMDKTAYKTQMLYPIPNTSKDGGRCCQTLGRSSMIWGAGKEYPVKGEDFAYMVYRKRNCCAY